MPHCHLSSSRSSSSKQDHCLGCFLTATSSSRQDQTLGCFLTVNSSSSSSSSIITPQRQVSRRQGLLGLSNYFLSRAGDLFSRIPAASASSS